MLIAIVATVLVLQCLVIYGAARWDYGSLAMPALQHARYQRILERLCVAGGTLFLVHSMLPAAVYRWEISAETAVELGVAVLLPLLLAWPLVRHWIMARLYLNTQRLLHLLLFYYIVNQLVGFVGRYLPYSMSGIPMGNLSGPFLYGQLLGQLGLLATALLAAGLGSKPRWAQVSRRLNLQRRLTLSLVGVAFLALAVTRFSDAAIAVVLQGLLEKFSVAVGPGSNLLTAEAGIGLVLMGTLGAGIGEEFFYRGLLQPRIGILWTSLLFAAVHGQYSWPALVALFVSSVLMGWVAKRYGLWVAILVHVMHNSIVYLSELIGREASLPFRLGIAFLGLGVVLWCVVRWCRACYKRRYGAHAPFTPEARPAFVSWLGVGLLCGEFLIFFSLGIRSWAQNGIWVAWLFLGLSCLLCVPRMRSFLLPRLRLTPARWSHLFAFYYLISIVLYAVVEYFFLAHDAPWAQKESIALLFDGIFPCVLAVLFACLGIGAGIKRKRLRKIFQRLGLAQSPTWMGWLVAPSLAVAICCGGYALWRGYGLLAGLWGVTLAPVQEVWLAHPMAFWPILAAMFLALFAEEVVFRGAIQPRLGIWRTTFFATLSGASLMYAFYGLSPALLVLFLYGLGSLLLGWVAQKYGVWMSTLTNCLVHTCVFWLFL